MNAERRKVLDAINVAIDNAQQSDEQDAYDAMPEGLQQSERGEQSQTALDAMQEAVDSLEQAKDSLCNIE